MVDLLFLHRKAGRLILVLFSWEREGQIGSWPTAQAETSNPLKCVARVETLPLKGPRLLIRNWIPYTKIITHTHIYTKATWRCLYSTRHNNPNTRKVSQSSTIFSIMNTNPCLLTQIILVLNPGHYTT